MSQPAEPQVHEFACQRPVSATVHIGGGSVIVTTSDEPVAVVTISPYDDSEASHSAVRATTVHFSGDRLRVDAPDSGGGWIFRRSPRVRIDLRVPVDSQLRAHVGSADVHADGRLAEATIHSGSGDIFVSDIAGDLNAESGSGDVRAGHVRGALRTTTASGDVVATAVGGLVSADAASGDVRIDEVYGHVRATTASGDIRIGVVRGAQARLNSASGDVTVGVPTGTRVWLDLSTMSGSTTTDLDLTSQPVGLAARSEVQLDLQAHTLSGDITVHRVAVPAVS
jgi:DUF4097 and DUF4098 domain-containing protein YvlB